MVDFNSDATVGSSPKNILAILLLQRQNDFLEALEKDEVETANKRDPTLSITISRLKTLFLQSKQLLNRQLQKEEFEKLHAQVNKAYTIKEILEAYDTIDKALDKAKITRIDTKTPYDSRSIEAENNVKNL